MAYPTLGEDAGWAARCRHVDTTMGTHFASGAAFISEMLARDTYMTYPNIVPAALY